MLPPRKCRITLTTQEEAMPNSILNTRVTTIDGKETSLEAFKGDVLLIVNVASQ